MVRERSRERRLEVKEWKALPFGPPSKLVIPIAIGLETVPTVAERDVEKGAKIALALMLVYDPAKKAWYPYQAPEGVTETVVKGYKPDTNTYEYLRLGPNYELLVSDERLANEEARVSLFSILTQTPLAANAEFTSDWEDLATKKFSYYIVTVYSDVDGTVCVQQSPNGTDVDREECISYTGGSKSGNVIKAQIVSRYVRVKYTNGAAAQSVFRLSRRLALS